MRVGTTQSQSIRKMQSARICQMNGEQRAHDYHGRQSLLRALAKMYTPLLGWNIDPETQVLVTAGANAGQSLAH